MFRRGLIIPDDARRCTSCSSAWVLSPAILATVTGSKPVAQSAKLKGAEQLSGHRRAECARRRITNRRL